MVTIRKFRDSDAKIVSTMITDTLLTVNVKDSPRFAIDELCAEYTPKGLRSLSRKRDIYVAVEKKQIVGSVAHEKNMICMLFINHHLHTKGLGSRLLGFIEEKIRSLHFSQAVLTASLSAKRFFSKHGYAVKSKQFDRGELTGIHMEKKLEQT